MNNENVKDDGEAEHSNHDPSAQSTNDEDLEMKQTRCNKLLHLLKRSRMYVTALNEQVQAVGMSHLRYTISIIDLTLSWFWKYSFSYFYRKKKKKKGDDSNAEALNNNEHKKNKGDTVGSLELEV